MLNGAHGPCEEFEGFDWIGPATSKLGSCLDLRQGTTEGTRGAGVRRGMFSIRIGKTRCDMLISIVASPPAHSQIRRKTSLRSELTRAVTGQTSKFGTRTKGPRNSTKGGIKTSAEGGAQTQAKCPAIRGAETGI
jgi:hypothetical protein